MELAPLAEAKGSTLSATVAGAIGLSSSDEPLGGCRGGSAGRSKFDDRAGRGGVAPLSPSLGGSSGGRLAGRGGNRSDPRRSRPESGLFGEDPAVLLMLTLMRVVLVKLGTSLGPLGVPAPESAGGGGLVPLVCTAAGATRATILVVLTLPLSEMSLLAGLKLRGVARGESEARLDFLLGVKRLDDKANADD
jgi:hypothetical protein